MKRQFPLTLGLLLLLVSSPATAEDVKKGVGTVFHRFTISGFVSDSDTTGTAVAPLAISPCSSNTNADPASTNNVSKCKVPIGFEWALVGWSMVVTAALSSDEQCVLGVSSDATGAAAASWSTTPIGDGATPDCDEESLTAGDLDTEGDWCKIEDSGGLIIPANGQVYLHIDEVSAASCDSLETIYYSIEILERRV